MDALQPTLLKQHIRGRNTGNPYSLTAWRIRVSLLALEQDIPAYKTGSVDHDFMSDLVKLSYLDDGPLLAKEFLLKNGIHFIVEPHLKTTHLDGAVMRLPSGEPLVAMTIRHDRLDNFWFTLCHELAHLSLHLDKNEWFLFLDDLDCQEENGVEDEADRFASKVLISPDKWQESGLIGQSTASEVKAFAESHRVHPQLFQPDGSGVSRTTTNSSPVLLAMARLENYLPNRSSDNLASVHIEMAFFEKKNELSLISSYESQVPFLLLIIRFKNNLCRMIRHVTTKRRVYSINSTQNPVRDFFLNINRVS